MDWLMTRRNFKYLALVLIIVVAAVGMWGWSVLSQGFSARDEPGSVEAYIAGRLRRMSIPRSAREAKNPVTSSPEVLSGAMEHFADHCAICHANDGTGKTLIGRGLYPKPPDMSQAATQELTDGELYYIIENGIRFTGMPAFGEESAGLGDEESWALVTFIRHLPQISVEEVEAMKKMNPKSPAELEKEERIRKFLEGDDSIPSGSSHEHHH
jgi:mono/diheme cytochrome c family protein